jgi:hypothetical protein
VSFLVHDILRLNRQLEGSIWGSGGGEDSVPCESEVGKKVVEGLHCPSMPHNCDAGTQ